MYLSSLTAAPISLKILWTIQDPHNGQPIKRHTAKLPPSLSNTFLGTMLQASRRTVTNSQMTIALLRRGKSKRQILIQMKWSNLTIMNTAQLLSLHRNVCLSVTFRFRLHQSAMTISSVPKPHFAVSKLEWSRTRNERSPARTPSIPTADKCRRIFQIVSLFRCNPFTVLSFASVIDKHQDKKERKEEKNFCSSRVPL